MRPLNPMDLGFLSAERRETPMHVGALFLFSLPDGVPRDYLRQLHQAAVAEQEFRFPFNQKLDHPASRLGVPHWVQDDEFDAGYHLRHSALPFPGRYRELFVLVSRLHGTLLDRSRPLWECHLIEGLQRRQFAMYVKVHHGLMDGVGAMRLLQQSLSTDPDRRDVPFAWSEKAQQARRSLLPGAPPPAEDRRGDIRRAVEAVGEQLGSLPGVTRALVRTVRSMGVPQDARLALPFEAPRSPLNVPVTGARRFVAQSYSLQRIHDVGRAYGATVNDVVLGMCSSALRRYLDELRGGVPDKPLVAMVPVSVRPRDGEMFGNAISAVLVNLGTHIADPVQRFEVIRRSMGDAKSVVKELSYSEVLWFTGIVAGPVMTPAMVGLGARLPSVNVVISNVPGPTQPLYWNGARLDGMYPASIVFHGMALNITLVSHLDEVDFGIVACRRALPRVQRLIDFLEQGLVELEVGAGLATG